jgi:predicted nuclease with TOPRIM domain
VKGWKAKDNSLKKVQTELSDKKKELSTLQESLEAQQELHESMKDEVYLAHAELIEEKHLVEMSKKTADSLEKQLQAAIKAREDEIAKIEGFCADTLGRYACTA